MTAERVLSLAHDGPPRRIRLAFAALLATAVVVAFWPTGECAFVFDDVPLITKNAAIQDNDVLGALTGRLPLMANRPLVNFALALQHCVFGDTTFGYRLVSVLLHLVNTWLLFRVLLAALSRRHPPAHSTAAPTWSLAAVATTLWAVHPLAVDAVAYTIQQSTLLMAMALLLALRCMQRSHEDPARLRHRLLAFVFTALGMACKEEMAPAPLLLILYDRAFGATSWSALRSRRGFHLALLATWVVLVWCIARGPENRTAGWHAQPATGPFEWLMTQAHAVVHYLQLTVVPIGLRGYYDWTVVKQLGEAILPGLLVLSLLGIVVWLWRKRPALGFPGAFLFLLLAPTSTILPIPNEVLAERRMYLPMLAVLVPVTCGGAWLLRRAGIRAGMQVALVAALAMAAVLTTRTRVAVYTDGYSYWHDAFTRNELTNGSYQAGMVLSNYGLAVQHRGDTERSMELFRRALDCVASGPVDRLLYARGLVERNDLELALPMLRTVVRELPDDAMAHGNLASVLVQAYDQDRPERQRRAEDPRLQEALVHARRAVALEPRTAGFANTLGWLLLTMGRPAEAEPHLRAALALDGKRLATWLNLSDALAAQGRVSAANELWVSLFKSNPRDADLRAQVAAAFLHRGDLHNAELAAKDALAIAPRHTGARQVLTDVQQRRGR